MPRKSFISSRLGPDGPDLSSEWLPTWNSVRQGLSEKHRRQCRCSLGPLGHPEFLHQRSHLHLTSARCACQAKTGTQAALEKPEAPEKSSPVRFRCAGGILQAPACRMLITMYTCLGLLECPFYLALPNSHCDMERKIGQVMGMVV